MVKAAQISFSAEYALQRGQDVMYVTERAVFQLTGNGVVLKEIAPGMDLEHDILRNMEFSPIIPDCICHMPERIFSQKKLRL